MLGPPEQGERCELRREGLLRAFYKGRDVYMYALLAGAPRPF